MEQAEVADLHAAVREHVLEAPAETRHDVKGGGAWACTGRVTGGAGDPAVLEADEALVRDRAPEDIRGQGGAGGRSRVIGLTLDVPGDGPALGGAVLQQSGWAHVFVKKARELGARAVTGTKPWAREGRQREEAVHMAWEARRCGERMQGRRTCGPGRGFVRWCWSHCGVVCCCHGGQWRWPQE
jgi:hypothetical protein